MIDFIALVPAWRKPECLYHSLMHLKASGCTQICVFEDWSNLGEPEHQGNLEVVNMVGGVTIIYANKPHDHFGVTFNVTRALNILRTQHQHVLLCEEDVLMSPDWIQHHSEAYKFQTPWACLSTSSELIHPTYNSIGVSFPPQTVEQITGMLFLPKYQFDEQLWHYVTDNNITLPQTKTDCAWHIGWWGYNTGNQELRPTGTLKERINKVHEVVEAGYCLIDVPVARKPKTWQGPTYGRL